MKNNSRKSTQWAIGATLTVSWALAQAANFTVSPVRVDLSPTRPSVALTVRNESADQALVIQLRTVAWSQDNGVDVHSPTSEVLATPPIFTVPPGGAQVVRVGLRHPTGANQEASYRLYLREVPPAPEAGFAGVQIAMEMNLPVFANPNTLTAPDLRWKAETAADGTLKLKVKNNGNAHGKVYNLAVSAAGSDHPVATYSGFAYILPGQTRSLPLERAAEVAITGGELRLKADSDAGEIDAPLATENQ